jgi:DNA-3-methyladenine glycosylase II
MTTFEIRPQGLFALRESALFGFGQRHETHFDGVMRLAFCLDSFTDQVGVELRQDGDVVRGTVIGEADPEAVRRQVARVLSLDHDADEFGRIGERDPVIGHLQRAAPGLRPPLFYSPYEAAAWSVLSARRTPAQATAMRDRLGTRHGRVLPVAGREMPAFPTPQQLLAVTELPGVPSLRLDWLHGIARAALAGRLDPAELAAQADAGEEDRAMAQLRELAGIGPFSAALILVRAAGVTDVLPGNEPRVLAVAGPLYGLDRPMTPAEFADRAQAWRPWRTWATVLIRAVSRRLSEPVAA